MQPHLRRWARAVLLSSAVGVSAGIAASLFLILLLWATKTRQAHPDLVWYLPLAGFFIGWVYLRFGGRAGLGSNLIIDEIHEPKQTLPLRMAPLILGSTVLTHLFGGSAGREGTVVQMGASLADQVSLWFRVASRERRALLVAGAGAGFSAAIGAPWAGVVFGMEVLYVGRLRLFAPLECVTASWLAYLTAVFLGAPHSFFPRPRIPEETVSSLLLCAVAGVAFGLAARLFTELSHRLQSLLEHRIAYAPLRPAIAGIFLCAFFLWEGSSRFEGLGIESIQYALVSQVSFAEPFFKLLATVLTVGSGFKGGEFIPLVFMGTTLGSSLGGVLPLAPGFLGALGFAASFGAAAKTPWACALMAMEIFGWRIGAYAVVACLCAYWASGSRGIYSAQRPWPKRLTRKIN